MVNTRWKKILSQVLWGALALLLLGFVWGNYHYSKGQVLNRYLQARQTEGDIVDAVKPYLVWADTKDYLTVDEGRRANFSRLTANESKALRQNILSAKEGDAMFMTRIGTKYWIFPDYRLALQPLSLTLKTNLADVDLLLNDRQVARSDSEPYQVTLDRLPVSDYVARLQGNYQGKPIQISKPYDGQSSEIDLSVSFKTFSVTSNLLDATLYLGDTKLAQLQDGHYDLEDYPISENVEVYISKTFPDGELKSKAYHLADIGIGDELDLSVAGLLTEEEAAQKVLAAFDQLLIFYSYGQDSGQLSEIFEGGTSNEFYQLLKTSIESKTLTDSRIASSLAIPSVYLTGFDQVGTSSYRVNFSAQYDFYYDKSTDVKKSQGHLYQNISGSFTLKKVDKGYKIANDQAYSLDLISEDNQIKLPAQPKSVSGLPSGLAGIWELRRDDLKATLYMTISSNGQLETKVVYDDKKQTSQVYRTNIKSYKQVVAGLYVLETSGGDSSALMIEGVGGSGITFAQGVALSGDRLTTVLWSAPVGESFDYEVYDIGAEWVKSKGEPQAPTENGLEEDEKTAEETGKDEQEDDSTSSSSSSEDNSASQTTNNLG